MSWSEVSGPLFFPCGCGEGEPFFFQVVFGVENGLSIVHFPLGQWTVDIPCKLLFLFVCLLGRVSKQRVTKFLTCIPKSSQ